MEEIKGQYVNILGKEIFPAIINIDNGKIAKVKKLSAKDSSSNPNTGQLPYILPGFIDAHVHIESSMLIPSEFAKMAVVHGTIATVSDPHEIANVCGLEGIEFMIANGKQVPFKFNFGAPSCVPATNFETSGAILDSKEISQLLQRDEIKYLSEMMNFPGVLLKDDEVIAKINAAKVRGKPVDGHAPGLRNEEAKHYAEAGITTDHECFTKQEALDKLKYGMKILIREGSAAKNFEALIELLNDFPESIMFCSDDKHPDSLESGHINVLCARAIEKRIDIFKILRAACINPVIHYKLDVGLLQENDPADFIIVEDLVHFKVLKTFINGELVAENGISKIKSVKANTINNFHCEKIKAADLKVEAKDISKHFLLNRESKIPVIEALEGQLITNKLFWNPKIVDEVVVTDPENDILKMVVVNRYKAAPVSKAFIKNFGLKSGALASSVAHDSHNILAVGVNDEELSNAVNLIIDNKGGISCVDKQNQLILALPVAGLMTTEDGYTVAQSYIKIDKMAKSLGSTLSSPFMTLSFMALLVIPHLKLSDRGLFDGDAFKLMKED